MYKRILEKVLERNLFKGKALIIVGSRQTGKTTLAETLIKISKYSSKTISFNYDNYRKIKVQGISLPKERKVR